MLSEFVFFYAMTLGIDYLFSDVNRHFVDWHFVFEFWLVLLENYLQVPTPHGSSNMFSSVTTLKAIYKLVKELSGGTICLKDHLSLAQISNSTCTCLLSLCVLWNGERDVNNCCQMTQAVSTVEPAERQTCTLKMDMQQWGAIMCELLDGHKWRLTLF